MGISDFLMTGMVEGIRRGNIGGREGQGLVLNVHTAFLI